MSSPCLALSLGAIQKWVQARSSLHHIDVSSPLSTAHGACRSPSPAVWASDEQSEEVVEHVLTLGQVVGGVDDEAVLAEEEQLEWC